MKVSNKKWIVNITAALCLALVAMLLSGFYGTVVNCDDSTIEGGNYTFSAAPGESYAAFERTVTVGDVTEYWLDIFVKPDTAVVIPLKTVFTPRADLSTETIGVVVQTTATAPPLPAEVVLGADVTDALSDVNGVVLESSVTLSVSALTGGTVIDPFGLLHSVSCDIFRGNDITVNVSIKAQPLTCPICGGAVGADGNIVHNVCPVCGGLCDGTGYAHNACEHCGGLCDGTAYQHNEGCVVLSPKTSDAMGVFWILSTVGVSALVTAIIAMKKRNGQRG